MLLIPKLKDPLFYSLSNGFISRMEFSLAVTKITPSFSTPRWSYLVLFLLGLSLSLIGYSTHEKLSTPFTPFKCSFFNKNPIFCVFHGHIHQICTCSLAHAHTQFVFFGMAHDYETVNMSMENSKYRNSFFNAHFLLLCFISTTTHGHNSATPSFPAPCRYWYCFMSVMPW